METERSNLKNLTDEQLKDLSFYVKHEQDERELAVLINRVKAEIKAKGYFIDLKGEVKVSMMTYGDYEKRIIQFVYGYTVPKKGYDRWGQVNEDKANLYNVQDPKYSDDIDNRSIYGWFVKKGLLPDIPPAQILSKIKSHSYFVYGIKVAASDDNEEGYGEMIINVKIYFARQPFPQNDGNIIVFDFTKNRWYKCFVKGDLICKVKGKQEFFVNRETWEMDKEHGGYDLLYIPTD